MARPIIQKQRGRSSNNRGRTKNVILFGFEGENKTEKKYFQNFQGRDKPYNIQFSYGNDTDPLQIVNNLISYMEDRDISVKKGDKIFCVFDSDVEASKQTRIEQAYAKASKKGIEFIVSVPSFEVWYLYHYKNTTHEFNSNEELIRMLKRYIPNYEKSKDIFKEINNNVDVAIQNSKFAKTHHGIADGQAITNILHNPSTDVYKVIEYIESFNKSEE